MIISISHSTHYTYESQVRASIQYLRLTPQSSARQQVLSWHLALPTRAQVHCDGFGNQFHVLAYDVPHRALNITASGQVRIDPTMESETASSSPLPFLRFTPRTAVDAELSQFAHEATQGLRSRAGLADLMHALHLAMPYQTGATTVETTAIQAYAQRMGVCQDHTHVFLGCCRHLGIPARYVSGYLQTDQRDHVASHAWAEAFVEDRWYTFDVVNNLTVADRHVKLAVGLDYLDSCPVRGVRQGGGGETMQAQVHVDLDSQEQAQQQQ